MVSTTLGVRQSLRRYFHVTFLDEIHGQKSTYYITILEHIEFPLISVVNDVSTIFSVEDGPIPKSFSILWMVVDM